jgi:hypothetical protein
MKIADVKNAGRDRGQDNEDEPGKVLPVVDPHREISNCRLRIADCRLRRFPNLKSEI